MIKRVLLITGCILHFSTVAEIEKNHSMDGQSLLPSEKPIAPDTKVSTAPDNHTHTNEVASTVTSTDKLAWPDPKQWQTVKSGHPTINIARQNAATGYDWVKASTEISASPHALVHLMQDVEQAPEWINNNRKVTILESPAPNVNIVHSFFKSPWPVKDRDMITRSVISKHGDGLQIEISNHGKHYPASKGYTRMEHVQGRWQVYPKADGKVLIQYEGTGDPSGRIPRWLANQVLQDSMLNTFNNLRQKIQQEKYQNKPLAYLKTD